MRSLRRLTPLALLGLFCSSTIVLAAPAAHAGTGAVYRPVDGAATTQAEQLDTLHYWLGPDLGSAAKLERPFAAASYTTTNDAKNHTSYAGAVPNMRENVPDSGDAGRLYDGGGSVATTAGKLFYVETGTRATDTDDSDGTEDVSGDYNYLGDPPAASPTTDDPWVDDVAIHRVVNGDGTTTDSWTGVCSANAVVSANKSTILTAGHCAEAAVYLGTRGTPAYDHVTMGKWIFVPGFTGITDHGPTGTDTSLAQAAPDGVWVATHAYTTPYWDDWAHGLAGRDTTSLDLNAMGYDMSAMTVVDPQHPGRTLTDTVGASEVMFDAPANQPITTFGYPQNPNTATGQYFGGRSLATCRGDSFSDVAGTGGSGPNGEPGLQDHGLWCNLTEGSSGGPMFYDFDTATGTGTQISVVSFKEPPIPEGPYLMGPQFGSMVEGVYDAIESTTP